MIIALVSQASVLSESWLGLSIVLVLFCLIAVFRGVRLDLFIIAFIGFWILINFASFLVVATPFSFTKFFGVILRILISYLGIKIVGVDHMWFYTEKVVYTLTLISIPMFLLDLMLPSLFDSFVTYFQPLTNSIFYLKEAQSNYWYSFVYVHTGRGDLRNSGFMWEPGAFAMVIVLFAIQRWSIDGFILNRKIFIYLLALITTFSTAGYISLGLLFVGFMFFSSRGYFLILLPLVLLLLNLFYGSLGFVTSKISLYLERFEGHEYYLQEQSMRYEANRILYFFIDLERSLRYPLGYGVLEDYESFNKSIKLVGVNGIGRVLYTWGWIGLTLLLRSVYLFLRNYIPTRSMLVFMLSVLVMFFSNPIENSILLYMLVVSSFVKKRI